jgi:hypothetical protein
MRRQTGVLAIATIAVAAISAGTAFDRRRRREKARLARPEIERWEEEGGALAVNSRRSVAQTRPEPQTF